MCGVFSKGELSSGSGDQGRELKRTSLDLTEQQPIVTDFLLLLQDCQCSPTLVPRAASTESLPVWTTVFWQTERKLEEHTEEEEGGAREDVQSFS